MDLSALQITAITIVVVASLVGVALFARTVGYLVRVIRLGAPDRTRGGRIGDRVGSVLVETLGHARLGKWPLIGIMHWFVFVGFGALFFTLVTAYGQIFDPAFALPIIGHWPPYEWAAEIIAWLTGLGILTLIVVRQVNHPRSRGRRSRFFGSTFWQAYYVELTILAVVVCVLALRGLEYALAAATGASSTSWVHYPTTAWIDRLFEGAGVDALKNAVVLVALVKILVSMAWFVTIALQPTMGVAWHRFLAFPNIWFKRHPGRDPERGLTPSLGEVQPIRVNGEVLDFEKVDGLDEEAALGVGKVEDFTWKGLLDFSTCTECGRCQSQCPAWNTDKPLSPKLLVMGLRDHTYAKAPYLQALATDKEPDLTALDQKVRDAHERPLVGATGYQERGPLGAHNPGPFHGTPAAGLGVIDAEVLWSCTSGGACVEQCPVDIEHVDHILDMRRHQVLIESAFPSELGGLFKNLENNSNPWGMSPRSRLDWAKGLPFEVKQVGQDVESLADVEYLFWVGCAGAFEDRAKKTTRAVAELLHTAGVDFAVLGDGEGCSGDPARRAGNEFLFQMLSQANVEALNEVGARKVVVTCAHCFNTLSKEYPQLGGRYEVVHHTQLLNRLVRDKRLVPVAPPADAPAARDGVTAAGTAITYHDPCYLGRHN